MPYQFQFPSTGFHQNLETVRCEAHNSNGTRCKRMVAIGVPYCFQHLNKVEHLKIKPSTIPGAGKGLFAFDKSEPQNAVIFKKKQLISKYVGQEINLQQLKQRYGRQTAPYAVKLKKDVYFDSATERGVASLANRATRSTLNNAKLIGDNRNHVVNLKAKKNLNFF